jgi:hypothetical protein
VARDGAADAFHERGVGNLIVHAGILMRGAGEAPAPIWSAVHGAGEEKTPPRCPSCVRAGQRYKMEQSGVVPREVYG